MTTIHIAATTSNGRSIEGYRTIQDGGIAVQLLSQGLPYDGLVTSIGDRLAPYTATVPPWALSKNDAG